MTLRARHAWMLLALVATLVAVAFAPPGESTNQVLPTERAARAFQAQVGVDKRLPGARTSSVDSGAVPQVLAITARSKSEPMAVGAFGARQWVLPQAAPAATKARVVVEAVAPLTAPTLPFKVLGRYIEDGATAVFLQHQEQNLVVRVGDTIGDYKVEDLRGTTLTLRYVPLNQTQTLEVGASP